MATKSHLVIDQGTTFSTEINLTDENGDPLNLTGYTANSLIRKWYTSSNTIVFGTSINAYAGIVTLYLDANASMNITAGRYVYDLNLTDQQGVVSRVVEGIITVTPTTKKIPVPANTNIFPNSAPLV